MLPYKNKSTPVSAALAEAQNLIDAAEEKAKKIIDEAIRSSEEIKDSGYREGLRIGKETATKNAVQIIREHEGLRENLEKEAAALTYKILEHIFSLQDPKIIDPIQQLAKKLLSSMPIGGKIDLVFHSSHGNSISSIKEELINIARNTTINFIESEEIDTTSLLIKTDFGEIKVGLRDFFSEIARQLNLPSR